MCHVSVFSTSIHKLTLLTGLPYFYFHLSNPCIWVTLRNYLYFFCPRQFFSESYNRMKLSKLQYIATGNPCKYLSQTLRWLGGVCLSCLPSENLCLALLVFPVPCPTSSSQLRTHPYDTNNAIFDDDIMASRITRRTPGTYFHRRGSYTLSGGPSPHMGVLFLILGG